MALLSSCIQHTASSTRSLLAAASGLHHITAWLRCAKLTTLMNLQIWPPSGKHLHPVSHTMALTLCLSRSHTVLLLQQPGSCCEAGGKQAWRVVCQAHTHPCSVVQLVFQDDAAPLLHCCIKNCSVVFFFCRPLRCWGRCVLCMLNGPAPSLLQKQLQPNRVAAVGLGGLLQPYAAAPPCAG